MVSRGTLTAIAAPKAVCTIAFGHSAYVAALAMIVTVQLGYGAALLTTPVSIIVLVLGSTAAAIGTCITRIAFALGLAAAIYALAMMAAIQ